jgi:hypothetical protein
VFNAVLATLAEIKRRNFMAMYEDWIEKLKAVIEIGGEYLT